MCAEEKSQEGKGRGKASAEVHGNCTGQPLGWMDVRRAVLETPGLQGSGGDSPGVEKRP